MASLTVWENEDGLRFMAWDGLEIPEETGYSTLATIDVPETSMIGEEDGEAPKFPGTGTFLWHPDFEMGLSVYELEGAGLLSSSDNSLSM